LQPSDLRREPGDFSPAAWAKILTRASPTLRLVPPLAGTFLVHHAPARKISPTFGQAHRPRRAPSYPEVGRRHRGRVGRCDRAGRERDDEGG